MRFFIVQNKVAELYMMYIIGIKYLSGGKDEEINRFSVNGWLGAGLCGRTLRG